MRSWTRMIWADEQIAFLREHYPKMGKDWCIREMGIKESQVRTMAAKLGLRVRPDNQIMKAKNARHAEILTGRKRPEQAEVMRQNHRDGKMARSPETNRKMGEAARARFAAGGHPRGFAGHTHSQESRAIISTKSLAAAKRMTPEALAAKNLKSAKTKVSRGTTFNKHGSWKAGWREVGGQRAYFRSRWEANYARYLQMQVDHGLIKSWQHEPKTFWFESIKRGSCSYLPDFLVVTAAGDEEYHEVKGWMDDRSKTKLRRMAKYHPEVKMVLIDSTRYRALERSLKSIISGWEASS